MGLPSRFTWPRTRICSPILNVLLVQPPSLWSATGLPPKAYQLTTLPWASFTSKDMPTCGLVNANFVTVPVRVVKRSLSDSAFEWCAKTEPEIRSKPDVKAKKTISLPFIVLPPDLMQPFIRTRGFVACLEIVLADSMYQKALRLVNQTTSHTLMWIIP